MSAVTSRYQSQTLLGLVSMRSRGVACLDHRLIVGILLKTRDRACRSVQMCGKKGGHGEGARERHDAASPNQAMQRGDATEVTRDKGAMRQGRCGKGGVTGRGRRQRMTKGPKGSAWQRGGAWQGGGTTRAMHDEGASRSGCERKRKKEEVSKEKGREKKKRTKWLW